MILGYKYSWSWFSLRFFILRSGPGVKLMLDLNQDRWAEIVALSRIRATSATAATAALAERRRQALEELITEVERLHARKE